MRYFYITLVLLFFHQAGMAQYCLDGNYCPHPDEMGPDNECFPGFGDEYALAESVIVDRLPSSTCQVGQVWAGLEASNPLDAAVFMAFTHGNAGNAYFRAYFNVDCDTLTGATEAFQLVTKGRLFQWAVLNI